MTEQNPEQYEEIRRRVQEQKRADGFDIVRTKVLPNGTEIAIISYEDYLPDEHGRYNFQNPIIRYNLRHYTQVSSESAKKHGNLLSLEECEGLLERINSAEEFKATSHELAPKV